MYPILKNEVVAEKVREVVLEAPLIARMARPGHFVLVRANEQGERIPLTIADSDIDRGTITLVIQEVGKSTIKLGAFKVGESYLDVVGPLGRAREVHDSGRTVCCLSGGLGVAPMFPHTKASFDAGNTVISIIGARNKDLFFWQDRVAAISHEVLYATDDGSFGHHGFATQLLEKLVTDGRKIDEVIAIGPVPHMKAVVNVCKKYNLPVVVSLNPIMVDGTGMCGGCRVTVGGKTLYACVDGPEFDGAEVDFDELMSRQGAYRHLEQAGPAAAAVKKHEDGEECRLDAQVKKSMGLAGDFSEVNRGYTDEEAIAEAQRCRICKKPKCVTGCPVEVDIPNFIKAIQEGDIKRAASVLKDTNSLPAICGRVCPQENQCEKFCLVGKMKDSTGPVHIGRLERYVADWEAAHDPVQPVVAESNGHKVAVVGSGPGGLTCAGDLAKMGYDVTVFEAFHNTGGVLRYGIPEFRLPKVIVEREVDYVKSLGAQFNVNAVIGKVRRVQDLLQEGYDAVFMAVGAGAPMFLNIPGENLIGVFSANELLTRVNLMKAYRSDYDTPVLVGERVAVIGAGNVAMDAARTSLRLGAKEVRIVYRRSEAEMPARAEEIENAKEEGVIFELLTNPIAILGDEKNRVIGMKCVRMMLGEPDESGRRRPITVPDSEFVFDCDMVVPALGNQANPLLTSSMESLALNKWGNIIVDPETMATNIPGVYAGGDIVTGSATVIEAMGAGKLAARAIDAYIKSKTSDGVPASV